MCSFVVLVFVVVGVRHTRGLEHGPRLVVQPDQHQDSLTAPGGSADQPGGGYESVWSNGLFAQSQRVLRILVGSR